MSKKMYNYFWIAFAGLLLFSSCKNDEWDNHYQAATPRVNVKMWDALQDSAKYSEFVRYVKKSGMDTLMVKNQGITLFVPTNDAFKDFKAIGGELSQIMSYHVARTVLIATNIQGSRKLQTLNDKFVLLEKTGEGLFFDGIKIKTNSPLFLDGTFYELETIAQPRPSLFEFTALYSDVLRDYIDSKNIRILDKPNSKQTGFTPDGQAVYDSVFSIQNYFELQYFSETNFEAMEIYSLEDLNRKVSIDPNFLTQLSPPYFSVYEEYRDQKVTFILFTQEQYNKALDRMADSLGARFNNYLDIPEDWQEEVLIPYFLDYGLFDDDVSYTEISKGRLKNVKGDSVVINPAGIDPASRFVCSNGVIYTYTDLTIPDSMYNDTIVLEGETLVRNIGGKNRWIDGVTVSHPALEPAIVNNARASGGKMLQIPFTTAFKDQYSLKFFVPKVFPRTYKLTFQSTTSGLTSLFEVYVNGRYIGKLDTGGRNSWLPAPYNDFTRNIDDEFGVRHRQVNGINNFAWKVDIEQYGDVEVTFKYINGGVVSGAGKNGLVVDYISLIPYNN
jgi:hypothetical protein